MPRRHRDEIVPVEAADPQLEPEFLWRKGVYDLLPSDTEDLLLDVLVEQVAELRASNASLRSELLLMRCPVCDGVGDTGRYFQRCKNCGGAGVDPRAQAILQRCPGNREDAVIWSLMRSVCERGLAWREEYDSERYEELRIAFDAALGTYKQRLAGR